MYFSCSTNQVSQCEVNQILGLMKYLNCKCVFCNLLAEIHNVSQQGTWVKEVFDCKCVFCISLTGFHNMRSIEYLVNKVLDCKRVFFYFENRVTQHEAN